MMQPKLDYYDMGPDVTAFSTTRHGGWSTGNYAAFNINRFCGDSEEAILKNREALCQTLGISDDRLIMPHQVHETRVAKADKALLSLSEEQRREALEGYDALMTNLKGICIGVSTADCIPILLYDKENHAVCAIHAGWRGTVKRIVERAIEAMKENYGTQPQQLQAQIGPGIHLDSFEVGDDVYDAFAKAGFNMSAISKRYPTKELNCEKWHIDLPGCNCEQLIAAGIAKDNIHISDICTFKQHETFFSARRLGINSGRIYTAILLKTK